MRKKKGFVVVKITGPDCRFGDRLIMPGETATVPAELASEWIETQRAVNVAAEDEI
jgi:hypothetical protein